MLGQAVAQDPGMIILILLFAPGLVGGLRLFCLCVCVYICIWHMYELDFIHNVLPLRGLRMKITAGPQTPCKQCNFLFNRLRESDSDA